jgi:signal transduction histidine kinase
VAIAPGRPIGIGAHLARRLWPIALIVGVLIGIAPPATYYVFERHALRNTATIYAQTFAERLHDIVADNPALWKYSGQKHAQLVNDLFRQRDITRIDILDEAGRPVDTASPAPPPRPWWSEAMATAAVAPIRFNNRVFGSVRVEVSHALLFTTTLRFAAVFAVAGAALALLVYRFPVGVVATAEARIGELVTSLDRQVKETDALLEIARATESSVDAEELFGVIAQGALRTCGADLCAVLVADDDAGLRMRLAARVTRPGVSDGDLPLHGARAREISASAVPALAEMILQRIPVVIDDAAHDPRLPPEWRVPGHSGAVFIVPLSDRNRVVGVLLLGYVTGGAMTADAMRIAKALGDQVALALHNVVLIRHLSDTVEQLRAKNAELDSFVYSVSHDLRAPLVSLEGLAGLLANDYGPRLDEDGRHYLERIVYNSSHMRRLLGDVLAMARVGREARALEPVDLRELVDEALERLAGAIGERRIDVVVRDLPTLVGVRTELGQVVSNLIGNAVKYLGERTGATIEVGSATVEGFVECWVRDTGIGIEPAYHEKIFQPFQRLQEIEVPGSGLGLAIVRKIVEGAGGRIWVESTHGEGATFRFRWPVPATQGAERAA